MTVLTTVRWVTCTLDSLIQHSQFYKEMLIKSVETCLFMYYVPLSSFRQGNRAKQREKCGNSLNSATGNKIDLAAPDNFGDCLQPGNFKRQPHVVVSHRVFQYSISL